MRDDLPSLTAEAVCLMRAADEARPADVRIIHDPYAKHFLRPATRALLAGLDATRGAGDLTNMFSPGLFSYIRSRHRFIDDALLAAVEGGTVRQLVIMGAGYDSRAWRLAQTLSGIPVFEVDFPSTGERKARLLEQKVQSRPDADVRRVAIDFQIQRLDERLLAEGFEPGLPTFFIWEGVSMYLTRQAVKATLSTVCELGGPGSRVSMDLFMLADTPDIAGTWHRVSGGFLHLLGEPVTFALHPEDAVPFLAREGWTVVDLADANELTSRYVKDGRRVHATGYVLTAEKT